MCSCCYHFFHLHTMFKMSTFFSCTWCWGNCRRFWWSRGWTKITTRINRTRSMVMSMSTIGRLTSITMTFSFKIFNIFFNNTIKFKNCFTNYFTIKWWMSCRWWNRNCMKRLREKNDITDTLFPFNSHDYHQENSCSIVL